MNLGELIRHRREQLGLTQDQVAARAGISKPYLSNIETGKAKNPPTDKVLRGLEQGLSVEAGEFCRVAHLARTPPDVRAEKESTEAELEKLKLILRHLLEAGDPAAGPADVTEALARLRDDGDRPVGPLGEIFSAGRQVPLINKVTAGYPHDFTDLDYPPRVAEEYVRCPDVHDANAFAARVVGDSMEPAYREGDIVIFAPNTSARDGDDCFIRFAETHETTFKRLYHHGDGSLRLQPLNPQYSAQIVQPETLTGLYPAVYRIEKIR